MSIPIYDYSVGGVVRVSDNYLITSENIVATSVSSGHTHEELHLQEELDRAYRAIEEQQDFIETLDVAGMVLEFHDTFGAAVRDEVDTEVPEKALRMALIDEEVEELREALGLVPGAEVPSDAVKVADALADILYVVHGAALTFGIDLNAVVAEVHRSNMSKTGPDGLPIMREDGKVLKGPGYFRPDVKGVLGL